MESDFSRDELNSFREQASTKARSDVESMYPLSEFSAERREAEFCKKVGFYYSAYAGTDINRQTISPCNTRVMV